MRTVLVTLLLVGTTLLGLACEKSDEPTTSPATAATPSDPLDAASAMLIASLGAADYARLQDNCADPLCHDLSETEFADLAAMVGWLGAVQTQSVTKTDRAHGGGQRWYALQFAQGGPVELEVSLDERNKLMGFRFGGEGYTDAEHGVIAEQWREFKVYDFHYLDAGGAYLPAGKPIPGNRVDYELVVGGIEALLGKHHLKVEAIVLDSTGKEIFHEPIEFDAKFEADAGGIPRGVVRGYLEVPGPGTWEMRLVVNDEHAMRDIEHRQRFDTVAAR